MPEGEQKALLLKRVLVYKKSFRTKYFQVIEREREREREREIMYTLQCLYLQNSTDTSLSSAQLAIGRGAPGMRREKV